MNLLNKLAMAQNWLTSFSLVTVAIIFCATNTVLAQKQSDEKRLKVSLCTTDTSISIQKILDNPALTTNETGCEVVKFSLSILPSAGEFRGPFMTKGKKIAPSQLNTLRELHNKKVQIFIDDIYVKCKGKDTVKVPGLNLMAHP